MWYFLYQEREREVVWQHRPLPSCKARGASLTGREGTYHREGRWVMESRAMPASLAAWKILPSTSMLTALVHSSRRAYLGLEGGG